MSYNGSTELISISSAAENAYVLRQLQDMRVTNFVWTGLNDRMVVWRYEWSDKSTYIYKNWASLEPSNAAFGRRISECTVIDSKNQNGTWETYPCSSEFGYICKRKIGKEFRLITCSAHIYMYNVHIHWYGLSQLTTTSDESHLVSCWKLFLTARNLVFQSESALHVQLQNYPKSLFSKRKINAKNITWHVEYPHSVCYSKWTTI